MTMEEGVYALVCEACAAGDELQSSGRLVDAKAQYVKALRLLPGDHCQWEAATWIYVAIGDIHFKLRNFERSFKCFCNAVQCPRGLGNAFIHLRLGQSCYELGQMDRAADELTRAYMGGGTGIFLEDDYKYLEFLETKIEI